MSAAKVAVMRSKLMASEAALARAVTAMALPLAMKKKNKKNRSRENLIIQSDRRDPRALVVNTFRNAPTDVGLSSSYRLGLSDILGMEIGVQAGFVYTGLTGTLGLTGSLYYQDNTMTYIATTPVPISMADANIGQTYVADLFKHFTSKRFRRLALKYVPIYTSTGNNCEVVVAPYRGFGTIPNLVLTGGPSPLTVASVLGAKGARSFSYWQPQEWDLTPYISGGYGAKQNEFYVASENNVVTSTELITNSWPCGFMVTGSSTSGTGLPNNVQVGRFLVCAVVDLLDFTGGIVRTNPQVSRVAPRLLLNGPSSTLPLSSSSEMVSAAAATSSGYFRF